MIRLTHLLAGTLMLASLAVSAQTTREEIYADLNKAGGVYYAYPVTETINTPAPKGYKPFYISHYGRHGSRYLISDKDYTNVANIFQQAADANALTPLGLDVKARIDSLLIECDGMGGALSPLGVRQHKAIAKRMYEAYPEVFQGNTAISARSTVVPRCILSMDAFCESLKEQNPKLDITRESANRYMKYLNYHSDESNKYTRDGGPWYKQYKKFESRHIKPDRLVESLFSDPDYVEKNIDPADTMWALYWIAVGMQDVETDLTFFDIFTPEELFDIWQCFNYGLYVRDGNFTDNMGLPVANARNLLTNVIESADAAIEGGVPTATLRFGHDGNLIPFAALLQLEGCYQMESDPEKFYTAFCDFQVSPMAGNVQMIFFCPEKQTKKGAINPDDVLVKFLHNEKEVTIPIDTDNFPFYRWSDVRPYLESRLTTPLR